MAILQLIGLRKAFGDITAVDGLTFTIERGEVFGLLGPNGAGKTTTVNMAIGLLSPDAGDVELVSLGSPTNPAVRSKIGVAPQALSLYEELSGEENVRFFGGMFGLKGQCLRERVARSLEFVGLMDRAKDRAGTYSGGMKRRLNLAIAIVHNPPLLILDEPTVGVDPQSRNAIFENIEALRADGCTVVYTTHYMEEAQRLCDRVGIIDKGKLLALDTVSALIDAHGGRSVVRIEDSRGKRAIETDDPVAALTKAQQADGLIRFEVDRPDLERVFLNLTGKQLRD